MAAGDFGTLRGFDSVKFSVFSFQWNSGSGEWTDENGPLPAFNLTQLAK
jgi:hypothetical protein